MSESQHSKNEVGVFSNGANLNPKHQHVTLPHVFSLQYSAPFKNPFPNSSRKKSPNSVAVVSVCKTFKSIMLCVVSAKQR